MNRSIFSVNIIRSVALIALLVCCSQTAKADGWFLSYGKVDWEVEKLYLFNFAIYLEDRPDSIGYIGYNWSTQRELSEMRRRVKRAENYLVNKLKIDRRRIVIVIGGKQSEPRTVLQPVQKGLETPDFS